MSGVKDIPDLLPLLSDAGASTADEINTNGRKRPFVSMGEHIHKWGTYLSVDWIFNATVGVAFAYWGKFTESGKKLWSGPISKMFNAILKPIIKDPGSLESSVGKGNMFMSIIAGGMFTIPPLMFLENSKVKKSIVKFFDRMIYGKDKVENDPKFQQAYDEIKEAPKKDFWTGMTSRFAALAPLLAIVLIPKTRDISNKIYFDHVANASETVATKMGFGAEKSFKNVALPEAKQRWKFIHEGVAMDAGLGIPYAILHAFFYNMFAGFKGKKKPADEPNAEPVVEPKINTGAVVADAAPARKFTDQTNIPSAEASHAAGVMNRRAEAETAPVLNA